MCGERNPRLEMVMTSQHRRLALVLAITLACVPTLRADIRVEKAAPAVDSTVTAPPPSIQVWLTEAPELEGNTLALRGPAGPIKLTGFHVMAERSLMAMVADKMPDGVYTVAWQATGHNRVVQKGEFTFTLTRAQ